MNDRILEANLRQLFERSYVPVAPRPEFRAALKSRIVGECQARFPAPAAARRAPVPFARRASVRWAALFVALLAMWQAVARIGSEEEASAIGGDLEAILASGLAAWRADGRDDWQPLAARGEHRLVEPLVQVATPANAELSLVAAQGARLTLGDDTRARLNAGVTRVELTRGVLVANGANDCVLETSAGSFRAEAGRVEFELLTPSAAADRIGLPDSVVLSSGDLLSVSLGPSARGRLLSDSDVALAAGERALVQGGRLVWTSRGPTRPDAAGPGRVAIANDPIEAEPTLVTVRRRRGALLVRLPEPVGSTPIGAVRLALLREQKMPIPVSPRIEHLDGTSPESLIRDIVPGTYRAWAYADGYGTWRSIGIVIEALPEQGVPMKELPVVDLRFEPAVIVRGVVQDVSGAPVAGAEVLSEADTPLALLELIQHGRSNETPVLTATDEFGRFELNGVAAGEVVLRAFHPDHGAAWSHRVAQPGELVDLGALKFAEPGGVRGFVDMQDGPTQTAFVVASYIQNELPCMSFAGTQADGSGRYELLGLRPGSYALVNMVGASPLDMAQEIEEIAVQPGQILEHDLTRTPEGHVLFGRIVDRAGRAFGEVAISVVPFNANGSTYGNKFKSVNVDRDGRYEVRDLAPGDYAVLASWTPTVDTYLIGEVSIGTGYGDVQADFTIAGGRLEGVVRSAESGAPLEHAVVRFELRDPQRNAPRFAGQTLSGPDGSFTAPVLRPGTYGVGVFVRGDDLAYELREAVITDDATTSLEFALEAAQRLAVRVTVPAGTPVAHARIRVYDSDGSEVTPWDAWTGADGRVQLGGLRSETYRIEARHPDLGRAAQTVTLVDKAPIDCELVLER